MTGNWLSITESPQLSFLLPFLYLMTMDLASNVPVVGGLVDPLKGMRESTQKMIDMQKQSGQQVSPDLEKVINTKGSFSFFQRFHINIT